MGGGSLSGWRDGQASGGIAAMAASSGPRSRTTGRRESSESEARTRRKIGVDDPEPPGEAWARASWVSLDDGVKEQNELLEVLSW